MYPVSLKTWRDPHTPGRCWCSEHREESTRMQKAEEEQKEKEEEYLGAEN